MEIGFTTHDPLSLAKDLPQSFANTLWGRDLSSWPSGFWIHIGRNLLCRETDTLSFSFNAAGQVLIIDGFGVASTFCLPNSFAPEQPAWAILDLSGRPSIVSIANGNLQRPLQSGR